MSDFQTRVQKLIDAAISADVIDDSNAGFIGVMGKSSPGIRTDIPAAYEAYTLLSHYLTRLPDCSLDLDEGLHVVPVKPAILHDAKRSRLVALLPIRAGELTEIAFWLTSNIPSEQVKRMAGVLALPFSIETHEGNEMMLPEWFAALYVNADASHCIPLLTLKSVMQDQRFGGDWVAVALERMKIFSLPTESASTAVKMSTGHDTFKTH